MQRNGQEQRMKCQEVSMKEEYFLGILQRIMQEAVATSNLSTATGGGLADIGEDLSKKIMELLEEHHRGQLSGYARALGMIEQLVEKAVEFEKSLDDAG